MKHLLTTQRGQALLIVLLTMAVVLTVVLSVVSRSVTDITVTTYEEDALRAFSAAEAGIEQALLKGTVGNPSPVTIEPNVSYDVDVTAQIETDKQFRYPKDLVAGETATFWLVSHDSNGQLICYGEPCFRSNIVNICWGNIGATVTPAVEIMYYYDETRSAVGSPNNYSSVKVARFAHSPSGAGNFQTPAGMGAGCDFISGDRFRYRSQINVQNDISSSCNNLPSGCSLMVKVRMYYASATEPQRVGIWTTGADSTTPPQGIQIESIGSAGESTRKINVFQTYFEPPNIFDAAVFSKQNLVKNN